MAEIALTASYETRLEAGVDSTVVMRAFRELNAEAADMPRSHFGVDVSFRAQPYAGKGFLRWNATEVLHAEVRERWDGEGVSRAIKSALKNFEQVARDAVSRTARMDSFRDLMATLSRSIRSDAPVEAKAAVPLRYGDRAVIGTNPIAFLATILKNAYPFSVDLVQQMDGMSAEIEGSHLVISGASLEAVGLAAAAFVRAPRPLHSARPKRPYWAYGTVAILAVSFALSWLRLSVGAIAGFGAFTLATTITALLLARREERLARTAVGLVPVLIVAAFAIVYATAGLSGEALGLDGRHLYMRDALLLSLSLASTVGFLDLSVGGWLRSIAYLEMLLVAGSIGTAAVVAGRSLSGRLDEAIRENHDERGPG